MKNAVLVFFSDRLVLLALHFCVCVCVRACVRARVRACVCFESQNCTLHGIGGSMAPLVSTYAWLIAVEMAILHV